MASDGESGAATICENVFCRGQTAPAHGYSCFEDASSPVLLQLVLDGGDAAMTALELESGDHAGGHHQHADRGGGA